MDTLERVKKVIVNTIPSTKDIDMNNDSHLIDDIGIDSMDYVELVMELESEFDIEIPEQAAETMKNLGDIVKAIDSIKQS